MYGGYTTTTTTNEHPVVFRKVKKDNRFLYQIEDKIIPLEDLITCPSKKIPVDISIRSKLSPKRESSIPILIHSTLVSIER